MGVSLEKKPKITKPGARGRLATAGAVLVGLVMVVTAACGPDTTKEPTPAPNVAATPAASAKPTPKKPITGGACNKAPKSMRADCLKVYAQHPYGVVNPDGGSWSAPEGPALVDEILNQGLSKAEMADYFKAEIRNYRDAVTAVKVNMDDLPSSDCWYEVGFQDEDGKLGGRKLTTIETVCP